MIRINFHFHLRCVAVSLDHAKFADFGGTFLFVLRDFNAISFKTRNYDTENRKCSGETVFEKEKDITKVEML